MQPGVREVDTGGSHDEPADPAWLYGRHAPELIRFATALVGPDRARDVVASAMARALFERQGPALRNPRAYLFRAVYNESISVQRQLARTVRLVTRLRTERPPDPGIADADDRVTSAIAGLSPRQRAVIVLTYWQDLEPADVATHLGISEGSVRKHLARARQNLRKVLS